MIKKRDNFLFIIPLLISIIIILITGLLIYNIKTFEISYINGVKNNLEQESKYIIWTIKPFLEKNDITKLDEYAKILKNKNIYYSICNSSNKTIINTYDFKVNSNEQIFNYTDEITTPKDIFTIKIYKSTDNIYTSFKAAEQNILFILLIGLTAVFVLTIYILLKVRIPFNKLQQSAVKIASGDLDTEIFVPKNGILWELARAINIMAKQLKRQIKNMKKLEQFRSEFIANVSHEIKTPLTSILSAVEI